MPNYGFEVRNNSDELLLNDVHDFFRLQEQGTSSTPTTDFIPTVTFTFSEAIPKSEPLLLAVRCDKTGVGRFSYNIDANDNIIGAECLVEDGAVDAVEYKLFVRYGWNPSPDTSANYGLQIFDGSGNTLYDSRIAELQVLDQIYIDQSSGTSNAASHVSRMPAFYDLPSMDHTVYEFSANNNIYKGWSWYKQTSDTTIESFTTEKDTGSDGSRSNDWDFVSDGKCILVDDTLY